MQRYYCKPIKRYVCFIYSLKDSFKVLMIAHTTGEVLGCITMPYSCPREYCAFINSKDYPWLYSWLIEKDIAYPTHRSISKNNFIYEEFKFKKED